MRWPRPWARGPLTDAAVVAVAVAAGVGALVPLAVPVVPAGAGVALALWSRRAVLVVAAVAVLVAGASHQARAGLAPVAPGPWHGVARLVADPVPAFGGWRVDVRTDLGRLELSARGAAGGRLSSRQAGEGIEVTGTVGPLADPERGVARHVRGRLAATGVQPHDDGGPLVRLVNRVRALVVDGAASLPEDRRALFTGFVLGDDRGSDPAVTSDFEEAGLSHLLVVSGQNVAFVAVVLAPLLTRLRRRPRFVATVAVLVLFAAVTRFEPSVLRATAMAGVGAVAVLSGRPVSGLRVLALAVAGLLVVDPLLATSLGFRLSVAASAGILVLARPVGAALAGPRPVRLAAGVTLSAQLAVAPLLVPAFGPMPVAALPANLLAEPVAGLVMMWGCTAGLVAGLVPPGVATVLHLPTRVGLWWVAEVARRSATAPLGHVGLAGVAVLAAGLGVAVGAARVVRPDRRRLVAAAATAGVLAGVVLTGAGPARRAAGSTAVGGATLWHGAGLDGADVLVVPGTASGPALLRALRADGTTALDLVVVTSPGPQAAEAVRVLRQRVHVDRLWAPEDSPAGGERPPRGTVTGGGLAVEVTRAGDGLAVAVAVRDEPAGAG